MSTQPKSSKKPSPSVVLMSESVAEVAPLRAATAALRAHRETTQYLTELIALRDAVRDRAPAYTEFIEAPFQAALKAVCVAWSCEAYDVVDTQAALDGGPISDDELS